MVRGPRYVAVIQETGNAFQKMKIARLKPCKDNIKMISAKLVRAADGYN